MANALHIIAMYQSTEAVTSILHYLKDCINDNNKNDIFDLLTQKTIPINDWLVKPKSPADFIAKKKPPQTMHAYIEVLQQLKLYLSKTSNQSRIHFHNRPITTSLLHKIAKNNDTTSLVMLIRYKLLDNYLLRKCKEYKALILEYISALPLQERDLVAREALNNKTDLGKVFTHKNPLKSHCHYHEILKKYIVTSNDSNKFPYDFSRSSSKNSSTTYSSQSNYSDSSNSTLSDSQANAISCDSEIIITDSQTIVTESITSSIAIKEKTSSSNLTDYSSPSFESINDSNETERVTTNEKTHRHSRFFHSKPSAIVSKQTNSLTLRAMVN